MLIIKVIIVNNGLNKIESKIKPSFLIWCKKNEILKYNYFYFNNTNTISVVYDI